MKAAQKLKNYILSEKLGESLQAVVYKAYLKEQPELPLILKQLKFLSGWADLSRYLRQKIERLKVLRDKRSCTPLAMESDLERHFIVQPWFAGNTLDAWSEGQKKLALADFFSIACSMADILRVVHEAGIVHGGIKPHNILVQAETLSVCLTDFITPLDIRDISHFIYDSGFVRGTLAYTSPEQTGRINHRVDFSTDLYSLGVVFYQLLTGRLPFSAKNSAQLIYKIINADAPTVSSLNPNIPSVMDRILKRALEKDLYSRYKSGAQMAQDLAAVRYQIVDDNYVPVDNTRFKVLRKLGFFTYFEEVELWEVLRISTWRQIGADSVLMREGDEQNSFGVIIEGEVEISVSGKRITSLGPGEVIGEMAYLNTLMPRRSATVTTITPITYLEVSNAALALSSEECLEHFRVALVSAVVRRLALANETLAAHGEPAREPVKEFTLELEPLDEDLTSSAAVSPPTEHQTRSDF